MYVYVSLGLALELDVDKQHATVVFQTFFNFFADQSLLNITYLGSFHDSGHSSQILN